MMNLWIYYLEKARLHYDSILTPQFQWLNIAKFVSHSNYITHNSHQENLLHLITGGPRLMESPSHIRTPERCSLSQLCGWGREHLRILFALLYIYMCIHIYMYIYIHVITSTDSPLARISHINTSSNKGAGNVIIQHLKENSSMGNSIF